MEDPQTFLDLFLEDQMELSGYAETWLLLGVRTYTPFQWISTCKARCFVAFSEAESQGVVTQLKKKQEQEQMVRRKPRVWSIEDEEEEHKTYKQEAPVDMVFQMDAKRFRPQQWISVLSKSWKMGNPETVILGISDLDAHWPDDRAAFDVLVAASRHVHKIMGWVSASRWPKLWSFLEASGRFPMPQLCSMEKWTRVWMDTQDTPKGFTRIGLQRYTTMARRSLHQQCQDRIFFTLVCSLGASGAGPLDHRKHLK